MREADVAIRLSPPTQPDLIQRHLCTGHMGIFAAPSYLKKYGSPTSDALVESAMRHISILDDLNFYDTKISVKSSSVAIMQDSYRKLASQTDLPLHIGVTEAGTFELGSVKSAIGIGSLLSEGIGDTIRVSLTDHPVKEVVFAKTILKALGHF